MNEDLHLALMLADEADGITLRHFRSASLAVRTKSDRTPVSEADEAVERMIRERLASQRPDDAIVGEEFGAGEGVRRWIIDPIDATKNYVRGIPVFATLIALEEEGRVIAGVVSAPAMQRRWWAARGDGAFCNAQPIHVSRVDDLGQAQLGYGSLSDFDERNRERFIALIGKCGRTRGFGDFWAHMLVAEGAAELAVEPRVAHWDMAAVAIVVEEAGGRFTSLAGVPRADAGSAVSSNGVLHDVVLEHFR